jgi:hypothetical protein
MQLDFGLLITGLGVFLMFSTLVVIIIVCEMLKRMFMEAEVETTSTEPIEVDRQTKTRV